MLLTILVFAAPRRWRGGAEARGAAALSRQLPKRNEDFIFY